MSVVLRADIVLKSIQNCEISFRCIKYFYDTLKFPMEWSPILTVISTEKIFIKKESHLGSPNKTFKKSLLVFFIYFSFFWMSFF